MGVRFAPGGRDNEVPTGRCVIVVTPDAERTMNTFLGLRVCLLPMMLILTSLLMPKCSTWRVTSSIEMTQKPLRAAAVHAHRHGRMVSLTLSDSFCVGRHRDDFRRLVIDEVDILFGNAEELVSLYETDTFAEAVTAVRADCPIAVVTMGERGSLVITPSEVIESSAHPVSHVVDTTGAGDLFAAGFLFAHTAGTILQNAPESVVSQLLKSSPMSVRVRSSSCVRYLRDLIRRVGHGLLNAELDDDVRGELQALIDGDPEVLATRFSGRLMFGTAGLRAEVGAGPLRMNRLVVRQAAAGSLIGSLPTSMTRHTEGSSLATTRGVNRSCSLSTPHMFLLLEAFAQWSSVLSCQLQYLHGRLPNWVQRQV